MALIQIRE